MLQKKGILTEEAKEKLMLAVIGKRPVTIDRGTEACVWTDGYVTRITIDDDGGINIYGEGLTLSIVKVAPEHVVLIPRRKEIEPKDDCQFD